MQINALSEEREPAPLWRLSFRAGFLLAGAYAVLAMARWLYWVLFPENWAAGPPPHWWHAHEMVFGFVMAVVAGFLLTAVANWTGIQGTRGGRLQLLFGLWLLARCLLWVAPAWHWLAWSAEMLFMVLLLVELTRRVWARRQWRNLLFVPILLALAALDTASYLSVDDPLTSTRLHYGTLWMVAALVVIVGGRVIPLFTNNRLALGIPPSPQWLDYLAIGSVVLIGVIITLGPPNDSGPWLRWLYLASSVLHFYRLWRWQGWKTGGVPLLWSMHLSYLCIPLTLVGLAWAGGDPVAEKNLVHLLAIGAIGGMVLTMMSRVSLGHTGRVLETPGYVAWAFAAIILAGAVRALLPLVAVELSPWAWRLSAALWIIGFSCFLYRYLPILISARADGKPG